MTHIAIIGAGLSGLTAANRLKAYANITLFEKSRGVGGRMSTRRADPYAFDHGAQFFTARSDAFRSFLKPLLKGGYVKPWEARYVEIHGGEIEERGPWPEDDPHFVGVPGMNAVAKYLSQGLHIQLTTRVQSIARENGKWALQDDQGNALGRYDWVLSTLPAKQSASILPRGLALLPRVEAVTMSGCFALMLGFRQALPLAFDAARVEGADIGWIAVNTSKPGRGDAFSLLVHSTNDWADRHMDDDRAGVMEHLCRQTSNLIGHDVGQADHKAIHGWRYANSDRRSGDTYILDRAEKIGICGDWCVQGQVEAAFTSGYDVATRLLRDLQDG